MKLVLLLILLSLVLGPLLVESGKIVRTWRRSSGPGRIYRMRPIMRRSYYAHPWEFYRRQRNIYIPPTHFDNTRRRHHEIQRKLRISHKKGVIFLWLQFLHVSEPMNGERDVYNIIGKAKRESHSHFR